MLELTREERAKLEETVINELCAGLPDDAYGGMNKHMIKTAVHAAIATIQEYERMRQTG